MEPNLPTTYEKLIAISKLREIGLQVGIAYLPILEGINSNPQDIANTLQTAKNAGSSFCIFGAYQPPKKNSTKVLHPFKSPSNKYEIEKIFLNHLKEIKMLPILPPSLYLDYLTRRDRCIVFLKQIALFKSWGSKNPKPFLLSAQSLENISNEQFDEWIGYHSSFWRESSHKNASTYDEKESQSQNTVAPSPSRKHHPHLSSPKESTDKKAMGKVGKVGKGGKEGRVRGKATDGGNFVPKKKLQDIPGIGNETAHIIKSLVFKKNVWEISNSLFDFT